MTAQWVTMTGDQIARAEQMLYGVKDGAKSVLAKALNRSLENARTNVVKEVRNDYAVRAGDVRDTIRLSKANKNRLVGVVSSVGPPLPLGAFNVRPGTPNGRRRSPITVAVRVGSGQKFEQAFVARAGGKVGVYERVGEKRLPIKQLFGPSVPQMVGNPQVIQRIADEARATMDKRLDHEINRVLNRGVK